MKTSVVILNWNGRELLERFLPSVLEHSRSDMCRVVVADNGSTDDSVAFLTTRFPEVERIVFAKNYGFAEGYNRAIAMIESEYVVLLNSDVETTQGWLSSLISYMDAHPDVAAVQPKIRSWKEKNRFEYAGACGGFLDRYGYPFCRGRILNVVEEDNGQYDTESSVFWATGAALCIRRATYLEVGGLDSRFFVHMEEIDLCWRLNARGWRVMCIPSSVIFHMGGASLGKENPKKMYLNFRNNLLMLYKNIPRPIFYSTFMVRHFFDLLAYLHLLLKGEWKNAHAVIQAYRDFYTIYPQYKISRTENIAKTTVQQIPGWYGKSILLRYYFAGKKTFAAVCALPSWKKP